MSELSRPFTLRPRIGARLDEGPEKRRLVYDGSEWVDLDALFVLRRQMDEIATTYRGTDCARAIRLTLKGHSWR